MDVRVADRSDVRHLAELRATWRGQTLTDEFLVSFRDWFEREESSRWWWLAVDGADAIGMVNVKLFDRMPTPETAPSRWGYLANLFVVPERRGAGVGASLVAAALERARNEGLVRLVLSPSEPSVPLYRRHGFRAAHDLLLLPLETSLGK